MTARRLRHLLLAGSALLTFSAAGSVFAAQPTPGEDEIDHLLQFVGSSPCTFIRNGTEYAADKARDHLQSKYRFVGSRISTAEEFIRYLATQSSMSGEPYHVHCGKADALAGVWLTTELNRYRKSPHVQASR